MSTLARPDVLPPAAAAADVRPATAVTVAAFIALWALVFVATFLETDRTRNDFERFEDQRLLILFLGLFVASGLVYVRTAVQPPALSRARLVVVALIALALLFASMPVGSRDLYLYAFYGKMWSAYGTDPYVHTVADFPNDPWQPYVQMQWSRRHMIYGPLFLWQSRLVGMLAGESVYLAVWLFKAIAAGALVWVWYLVARIAARTADHRAGALLLTAWNPLLLFEVAGNGHNDVIMALLLVAAVWCWQRERLLLGVTLVALSFWYKWYGLLLLPVFLTDACRRRSVAAGLRLAAAGTVAVVVIGALALHWVPGAAAVIAGELRNPLALSQIYPTELSPVLAPWFWSLHAVGAFDTARGADVFHAGRLFLFAAAYLAIIGWQWRRPASTPVLIESLFLASLTCTMLLMTILWPWHLMVPICFGLLTGRPAFVALAVGLTLIGLLSYFLTLAIATLGVVLIAVVLKFMRARR